jgi:RNaseH domain of pPIWI_RE/MID domain of pPIWI_RE
MGFSAGTPLSQVCQPGEESRLEEYVSRLLGTRGGISCAILEMPEVLRDDIGDPYPFARRALARSGCLAQVLLVDEPAEKNSGDDERSSNKWRSSLRDCFRMLGVVPEEAFESKEFSPAAFTIIQRDSFSAGEQRVAPFAVPVMSRLRAGALECLLPGVESWLPYAYAALKIFAGQYERWSRGRDSQNTARFEAFFISALEQPVGLNERIVLLIDQESTAHRIKAFQNGELKFDHLEIGGRDFTPEKLPNLCIVRINTDYKRAPFYSPTTEVQWPRGLFKWPDQKRTVYSLNQKPASVGGRSKASLYSRHSSEGKEGQHQRLASQLDEMSVIFKPLDVDALRVASYAHRLRRFHEQYDGDTQLPFPLHELLLLKKSVTF